MTDRVPLYKIIRLARHAKPVHVTPPNTEDVRTVYFEIADRHIRAHVKYWRVLDVEVYTAQSSKYSAVWRRIGVDGALGSKIAKAAIDHFNKEQYDGST